MQSGSLSTRSRCLPQAGTEVDSPARCDLNHESLHGHAGSKNRTFLDSQSQFWNFGASFCLACSKWLSCVTWHNCLTSEVFGYFPLHLLVLLLFSSKSQTVGHAAHKEHMLVGVWEIKAGVPVRRCDVQRVAYSHMASLSMFSR